jgi:hypothetical protein
MTKQRKIAFDPARAVDTLLPMFGNDLDTVAQAIDKGLAELVAEGAATDRHYWEVTALHTEILRRLAA